MTRAAAAVVLGLALAALAGASCEDPSLPMGSGGFGATAGAGLPGNTGGGPPAPVEPTDEQWARLQTLRWVDGPPPPDVTNAFADDDDAAIFGQRLFFDARLSGPLLDHDNDGKEGSLGVQGQTGRVSCAGCHIPEAWFSDNRSPGLQISLAAGWVLRRTPPLLDVGHKKLLNWDARRDTFYGQAIGVFEAPKEMNSSRYYVALAMFEEHREEYEAIFGPMPPFDDTERFPALPSALAGCPHVESPPADCEGRPGDQGVFDALSLADQDAVTRVAVNTGKALGAYLRKLSCGAGRFDAWLDGDDAALSDAEKRGAILFVEEGRCIDCHTGPRLTDDGFHNVGLRPDYVAVEFIDADDPGALAGLTQAMIDPLSSRGPFSDGDDGRLPSFVKGSLLGAFSTPSLRCISRRPSFFHTGQERHLIYVMEHFNDGGHPDGFLGLSEIEPLGLDDGQIEDLIAFLLSLDGPGPEPALLAPP
jgi:cytochrome c peroxidase